MINENFPSDLFQKRSCECPECGNANVITDELRGEKVCSNCGLVLSSHMIDYGPEWKAFIFDSHMIDYGPEWTAFIFEEHNRRSRVGMPQNYGIGDKSLSTWIGWENKDIYGKEISEKKRSQIRRPRRWQTKAHDATSTERNIRQAFTELCRLASQLGVPKSVKEMAVLIYRRAVMQKIIKGRSIDAMVAAAFYAALRIRKIPRSLYEISKESGINKKDIGKCYRVIVRELGLQIPHIDPIDYIYRFGEELHLSGKTQRKAAEILETARNKGLTMGKDPVGLAASAIYISCIKENERRTQREIADVTRVTEVTVRNRYKELIQQLGIEITV